MIVEEASAVEKERNTCDSYNSCSQSIESVYQIDCIRDADNPQHREQWCKVGTDLDVATERNLQLIECETKEIHRRTGEHLTGQFRRGGDLPNIVEKPDTDDHERADDHSKRFR